MKARALRPRKVSATVQAGANGRIQTNVYTRAEKPVLDFSARYYHISSYNDFIGEAEIGGKLRKVKMVLKIYAPLTQKEREAEVHINARDLEEQGSPILI